MPEEQLRETSRKEVERIIADRIHRQIKSTSKGIFAEGTMEKSNDVSDTFRPTFKHFDTSLRNVKYTLLHEASKERLMSRCMDLFEMSGEYNGVPKDDMKKVIKNHLETYIVATAEEPIVHDYSEKTIKRFEEIFFDIRKSQLESVNFGNNADMIYGPKHRPVMS